MVVGVPGTGIGGLFYLLAAALMPVREAWLLTQGRSSWARWRFIGRQWAMIAGMLASLWATMWLVKRLAAWSGLDQRAGLLGATPTGAQIAHETNVFLAGAALGSLISLTAIMLIVHILRVLIPQRGATRPAPLDASPIAQARTLIEPVAGGAI